MNEQTSKERVLKVYPDARCIFCEKSDVWCVVKTHLGGTIGEGDTQPEAWDDAASRLPETKLPSSPAGGSEPVRKVLTKADIEKLAEGNHCCGWTIGAVKNPNPACGCMCGTVYAPDGRAILSHSGRHGMRCQHADERGNLLAPKPLGDISGPKGSGGAAPEGADDELPPWIQFPCPTCHASSGAPCIAGGSCMRRVLLSKSAAPIAPAAVSDAELIRQLGSIADDSAAIHDSMVGRDSGISTLAGRCCDVARSIIASLAKPSAEVAAPIAPAAQELDVHRDSTDDERAEARRFMRECAILMPSREMLLAAVEKQRLELLIRERQLAHAERKREAK